MHYFRIKTCAHFLPRLRDFQDLEMTCRAYVNSYRLKLIQKRLHVPSISTKQNADESGFTDEDHLSHFFKMMRERSPSQFRNGMEQIKLIIEKD